MKELESEWIPNTRTALLQWLTGSRERATRASDTERVQSHLRSLDREWSTWEPRASLDTGELTGNTQERHDAAMKPIKDQGAGLHQELHTWHKHVEFRYAQAAWEDFLYFQNEWNRRSTQFGKIYYETNAEKKAARKRRLELGAGTTTPVPKYMDFPDDNPMKPMYYDWADLLISRYSKFELGSRKSMPTSVGPDVAHRYSQPPRGTTPLNQEGYEGRHDYLEKRFPARVEGVDLDKKYPTSDERSVADSGWNVNNTAFASEKKKRDQGYLDSPETRRLLPTDHVLHHGVLESSFDWPTSFDAAKWGNTFTITATKRNYVYQEEEFEASDGETKRRPKKDEQGRPIRLTEVCGYKKVKQTRETDIFIHVLEPGGNVKGRDRDGKWNGKPGRGNVTEFVNDPRYTGPEPDVRYRSKTEFKVLVVDSKWPRVTRYQRHIQAGESASGRKAIVDQLSDDEAPDCIKSNVNFGRSGNVKFDSGVARGDRDSAGHEHIYSDDDEDDEDDPFTKSYLECSGKVCNDAKEHLVELKNIYGGATPGWTYHNVVALVDVGATQKEVARIYQEALQVASRDEHSSTLLVSAARQLLALEEEFGDTDWTISQVAADLLKEPKDGELAELYQKRVQETEGRAVTVLASLVEEFGNIGWTPKDVAGRLLRETEEVLKRNYKEEAQLLVTTAKKRKAEGTGEPEETEHGALRDS